MHIGLSGVVEVLKISGIFAPILFILLQAFRQFFFIPVSFVCLAGGLVFGAAEGSIYSIIGISASSMIFYGAEKIMPKLFKKIKMFKKKWMGRRIPFTVGQITILKLIPFIHFHLLSFCLMEISANFKDYAKKSILSNIPLAILYSSFGKILSSMSLIMGIATTVLLGTLFYLLRKREWIMKWEEFFEQPAPERNVS